MRQVANISTTQAAQCSQKRKKSPTTETRAANNHSHDALTPQAGVKVPKFSLRSSDGDALKWKQCKDLSEATIHSNQKILNIE